MTEIAVAPDFLLGLLTEIGRHRALADHETDIIESIVCRGHKATGQRVHWTSRLDRLLIQAAETKGGTRRFATRNNMPPQAAYDRLHKLRKAKRTTMAAAG